MENTFLRLGMLTMPWWLVALAVFGGLEPNYSQWYKAVSELGAFGAANPLGMNLICLFIPGVLTVLVGVAFRALLIRHDLSTAASWWLMIFGIMFSGSAVPADLELYFDSPWTVIHAFFVLLAIVPFFIAAWKTRKVLAKLQLHSKIVTYLPWAIIPAFCLNAVLIQGGLVQRLTILITLSWVSYLSWFILSSRPVRGQSKTTAQA